MKSIYEKELRKYWQNNIKEVKELLEKKDKQLMLKISKASHKWKIDIEEIKSAILENKVAAASFAINPTKQNIYEKTAADIIRKIAGVNDFKNLPNDKLFVIKGMVIEKKEIGALSDTKSIDFSWSYNNKKIYASHKYTSEEGGAQSNQYKDLKHFIEEARHNKDGDIVFIAIADGPFYLRGKTNQYKNRIEEMQKMCTPAVKVCDIYGLEDILNNLKGN